MPDLDAAMADLRLALGDLLDRGRADGVFHVQVGGPGGLPALADLDVPELHLDLLPGQPTDGQRAALRALGYRPGDGLTWTHPGGWRVVRCDHGSGWAAAQRALRALLRDDPSAAATYRAVYTRSGRAAADRALEAAAVEHHARTVGWRPLRRAAQALAGPDVPWMIAGGYALDLHAGRVTRPHDDIDLEYPRDRQADLPARLRRWRLDASVDGAYRAFAPPLVPPAYQIHARHPDLPAVLMLDVMLADHRGGVWRYRRDPTVTRPLAEARRVGAGGLPYLAPELVLLFKAGSAGRDPRGKDHADFERTVPTLDAPARAWLRGALDRTQPGHPWLARL